MRTKEYYILFLLLQVGMLGVFMSLDFFLFYMFWEVMLVPMYFLIGVWGSDRRLYAAIKFFLYTLVGSVLMLLGILALYFKARCGAYTFDMPTLLASAAQFDTHTQVLLFWALLLRLCHQGADVPVPHLAAGCAHRSAHGRLRHPGRRPAEDGHVRIHPLLAAAAAARIAAARHKIVTIMLVLSIIGIIYGALVCMMQKDMKKLIAYSSVSHLGFCTLGIFALTPHGLSGSVIQQINHGTLHRRALLADRRAVRTPAHAPDFGVWRALHAHAEFRRHLHDRHAQLAGLAAAQRIHR